MKFLIILVGLSFLCGCESVKLADSSIKPIVLKETYQRVSKGLNTIQFPSGVYQPDFTTTDGVYYRGLYLAAKLGRTKDLFKKAAESLQQAIRAAAKDSEKFRCCQFMELLINFRCGDPTEFAP